MNLRRILVMGILSIFLTALSSFGITALEENVVQRYDVFEQTFDWNSSSYSNPWEQVDLTTELTSPTGSHFEIGGFYSSKNRWKFRFAPTQLGLWTWQATISDPSKYSTFNGSFNVVDSTLPGFVRQNPDNPFRWVFDDGSPFYPLGIGDCLNDDDKSGSPLDNWGFDGGFRAPGTPDYGAITDFDTYWKAYSGAGVNLFRWSLDNCAFGLYEKIDPSGNVYKMQEGLWGDELVQRLRQYGVHLYLVIFGFNPAFPTGANNPAQMDAVKRYVKYVTDRYGAYVDFWELMNEFPNPPATISDDWYKEVGEYLRSIDPYKHPISTSWQRPDLPVIEITAPHWYQKESEFESDVAAAQEVDHWKSFGKPVIFGEQGNSEQNWDEKSALRMRIRNWTAFFREGTFIFWNSSFAKDYHGGVASNIYLGPQERGYLKVLQDFTRGFDGKALISHIAISSPERVRGYALSGPTMYAAYLHAFTNHDSPTTGIKITINPALHGSAVWLSPETGEVFGNVQVSTGSQTLDVPPFNTDIALKIMAQ
ncbi:DUF5060 domain-containing protein [Candidatus Acetothermia bacterium]|nr:DUF5060 domain-containing protein [Candidatus Acetothermia bacterium]